MKKVIFYLGVFILIFSTLCSTGQTEKGKLLLGGQSSLSYVSLNSKWKTDYNNGDDGKTVNLDITPQVGYFVANNLVLGLEIPYSMVKETEDGDMSRYSSFTFAPFIKYYIGNGKIKPYLQGARGKGKAKSKIEVFKSPDIETSYKLHLYELGGGVAFFLNESVSLDLGLGYASVSSTWKDRSKVGREDKLSGIGVKVGISVVL